MSPYLPSLFVFLGSSLGGALAFQGRLVAHLKEGALILLADVLLANGPYWIESVINICAD